MPSTTDTVGPKPRELHLTPVFAFRGPPYRFRCKRRANRLNEVLDVHEPRRRSGSARGLLDHIRFGVERDALQLPVESSPENDPAVDTRPSRWDHLGSTGGREQPSVAVLSENRYAGLVVHDAGRRVRGRNPGALSNSCAFPGPFNPGVSVNLLDGLVVTTHWIDEVWDFVGGVATTGARVAPQHCPRGATYSETARWLSARVRPTYNRRTFSASSWIFSIARTAY